MGFNDIAKKKAPTASKSKVKVAAEVTDEVKGSVDVVIASKAQIKRLEAELADAEAKIIDHVRPQYVQQARSGNFTKSLTVEGNTGDVTFVTSDRFSTPKDEESQIELRKLLGKKFEEYFEEDRSISIKKNIVADSKAIAKIEKIFEKAGEDVADFFDVVDVLKAKDGLDQKQFELPENKRQILQTLAPQAKPAVKC